jgi:hypothetical protein
MTGEVLRDDRAAIALTLLPNHLSLFKMSTAILDAHLLISQRLVVLDHMSQSSERLRFMA